MPIPSVFFTAAVCAAAMAFAGASPPQVIGGIGLEGPEAARYDSEKDRYIVSNLGQRGIAHDGFISLISPEGELVDLKWIAGGEDGVELHDPLGVFIAGGRLYVADTTAVRVFDLDTGAPLDTFDAPGAIRLNDLAIAADGTLYITDSATDTQAGALYRLAPGATQAEIFVERGDDLARPNGIAVTSDGLIVHGGLLDDRLVFRAPDGSVVREQRLPTGRIDGIVALDDGRLLVASQDGGNVYLLPAGGGEPIEVASGIAVPAAIGFDTRRNRILIPQIAEATLTIVDLP